VVGIDDLVADVEVQITVHKRYPGQESGRVGRTLSLL
jgi:hypothetical protein